LRWTKKEFQRKSARTQKKKNITVFSRIFFPGLEASLGEKKKQVENKGSFQGRFWRGDMGPVHESRPGYWDQMRQSLVGRKIEAVGGDELLR
jgi:hypothetical protein